MVEVLVLMVNHHLRNDFITRCPTRVEGCRAFLGASAQAGSAHTVIVNRHHGMNLHLGSIAVA